MSNKYKIIFLALLVVFSLQDITSAQEKPPANKKLKFSWNPVDWGFKYKVEIKNLEGRIVFMQEVNTSSVEFSLPPGKYKIRIGVVDKFENLAAWSSWQDTEIMKKKPSKYSALNLGIKITAGIPYTNFIGWETPFGSSYKGITAKIGFTFGDFILFQPSDTLKYTGFLNYLGVELEGSRIQFKGIDVPNRVKMDMTGTYVGGNLYFTTNLNFPANLIIRAGGGAVRSDFNYITGLKVTSEDPYYKAGCSLELTFFKYLIFEAGADYMMTQYLDFNLQSVRYFFLLGVKI